MKVHHCIDVCCGGRMFWFDKHNPDVFFMKNGTESEADRD